MGIVLITGCSNGIGRITATALAAEGHTVYASMRRSDGRNKSAKLDLEAVSKENQYELTVLDLDVTDEKSVQRAVDEIIDLSGRIDVLVNNAGEMNNGVTEAFTLEQVQRQFDVNFFGSVRTCRAVAPFMRKQGSGLLIQISSLAGRAVFPYFGIYCASKYAVETLAETYRYELKPFGIDSVIVEPGPFATGLFRSAPKAADVGVLVEYGEFSRMPGLLLKAFEDAANREDAPKPRQVADAICALIRMDGDRPLRTIVSGYDFDINELNVMASRIQQGVVNAMGLDGLDACAA